MILAASVFNNNFLACFLYTTIVWGVPTLLVWRQLKHNENKGPKLLFTAIFAFLSGWLSIQCGDFFYYAIMLQTGKGITHLEEFYRWLMKVVQNYMTWRAIVWAGATLFYFWTVKRIKVNQWFASFIFVFCLLFYWGNMRNMLGFSLLFFGTSLLFYPLKMTSRVGSIVLGIVFIYCSLFFHRSMLLYSVVMMGAFIPWGKQTIRLSVIAFPFLYTAVFILARFFLTNFGDNEFQDLGSRYIDIGKGGATFMQNINTIIQTTCYCFLMWKCCRATFWHKYDIPQFFVVMLRFSYMLMYAGLLFYGQENADWLAWRFLNAANLGLTFPFMYILYRLPRTNGVKLALVGIFYMSLYNWMYLIYTANQLITRLHRIML